MQTIVFELPENLSECDWIGCRRCYLAQAQTIFGWKPTSSECFFRKEFIDYKYLTGNYSRGKDMNEAELIEYKKTYKPNQRWMEIIKGRFNKSGREA